MPKPGKPRIEKVWAQRADQQTWAIYPFPSKTHICHSFNWNSCAFILESKSPLTWYSFGMILMKIMISCWFTQLHMMSVLGGKFCSRPFNLVSVAFVEAQTPFEPFRRSSSCSGSWTRTSSGPFDPPAPKSFGHASFFTPQGLDWGDDRSLDKKGELPIPSHQFLNTVQWSPTKSINGVYGVMKYVTLIGYPHQPSPWQ